MTGRNIVPAERIAEFVDDILVIEHRHVKAAFALPLFANGKPTLLFQSSRGTINNSSNYLTLFGQTLLPTEITFSEDYVLIAYFFKPFALTVLFGFTARELTDNPVSLNLIQNQQAGELQERLLNAASVTDMLSILDDFVYSLITRVKTDKQRIEYATRLIADKPTKQILATVQDKLAMTERTFQRLFEQHVGISPNQYRRVAQFNAAFQQLNRRQFNNIMNIAFTHDYADQSHFIRTFREFTNMTPKEYLSLGTRP